MFYFLAWEFVYIMKDRSATVCEFDKISNRNDCVDDHCIIKILRLGYRITYSCRRVWSLRIYFTYSWITRSPTRFKYLSRVIAEKDDKNKYDTSREHFFFHQRRMVYTTRKVYTIRELYTTRERSIRNSNVRCYNRTSINILRPGNRYYPTATQFHV